MAAAAESELEPIQLSVSGLQICFYSYQTTELQIRYKNKRNKDTFVDKCISHNMKQTTKLNTG